MVIDRGAFLAGDYGKVFDEIVAVKQACGAARLKVILETGELATYDNVRRASWLALLAGGDFIKTSTGKIAPAATLPVTHVMLQAVRDWYDADRRAARRSNRPAASGTPRTRSATWSRSSEVAGPEWLDPFLFRFGASVLLNDLLMQRRTQTRRPLLRPRLRDGGLTWRRIPLGNRCDTHRHPARTGSTHRRRSPRRSAGSGTATRCSSAAGSSTAAATTSRRINPATEEPLAIGLAPRRRPTSTTRSGAARTRLSTESGRGCRGAERGKYLFRIARGIAERARELAVVETLDNGKPIKESRDVDVPTASAHFFYHAGWADKLQHAGFGAGPQPLGVAGQVIPWNFPLLMAAWKIAPALAAGNTVVIKPAETTPLSILVLAEIIADADLPPGVVNIVTGAGDIGAGAGRITPASTRSRSPGPPRWAGRSSASLAGTGRKTHPGTGRQGREHRLRRRARSTRPSRASSTASSSTRATSAAPDPACWCRNRSPTR